MRKILAVFSLLAALAAPTIVAAQAPPPVPALPDTERRTAYVLTASTCPACSVGFALYGDGTDYGNWIEVWIVTGTGTTALATKLTAVTDYTLVSATGPLGSIPRPITNATITLTAARTGTLQIVGATRPRRLSQFAENRGVAARDLNQALTGIIAAQRDTWDRTIDLAGRALQTSPGDTIGMLPISTVRAGGLLGFNSLGDPIALAPTGGLGNVIGPNVSVVGHIATFGNTTGTILLDGGLIGAGDVTGAASSLDNQMAVFSGTGGKTLKATGPIVTPSTGTITLTNGKTIAVTNTLTLGGTDGSTVAFGTGGTAAYTGNNLSVFAATTSAQLLGVISDETGTGALVFANTPTMVTPVLGVATATSINKVAITAPATSATLTIADGKTLAANNTITLAGTDGKSLVLTNGLTVTTNDGTLAFGGATKTLTVNNSIGLSGTDGKTLTVSNSGTLGGADGWTLAIAASKTLTVSNSLALNGTDATTFTFPSTSGTIVTLDAVQTLTNKSMTGFSLNGGAVQGLTLFGIRSTGTGAFDLTLVNSENLTASRALTLTLNNANRTISMSGNLTLGGAFTVGGSAAITLTAPGTSSVNVPTSGTLAAIDIAQTFSSTNIFSAVQQFTDLKFSSGKLYPTADSTTALQLCKADGTTCIVRVDTSNSRVGINKTPGAFDLDVNGAANVGTTLTFGTLSATSLGASPTTITGLTVNNSPNTTNDYFLYFSAADGAIRKCTVGSCASAAAAGVSSLNGLTGSLSITQGSGINVSAGGSAVTLTAGLTTPRGRLTIFTGLPVLVTSVSAAASVIYTPYEGNTVPIYDGTNMVPTAFSELTNINANSAVGSAGPAVVANNSCYDYFIWNNSSVVTLTRGPLWTSTTARSAGTALVRVLGVLLNNAAITNGPAASRGTYVGTACSNGTATFDYTFGGSASGGTAAFLGVWNMYNRVTTTAVVTDSGAPYTYASATVRQARASAGNQISIVMGLVEDGVSANMAASAQVAAAIGASVASGIGYGSLTTYQCEQAFLTNVVAASWNNSYATPCAFMPSLGLSVLSSNENSDGTNTSSFNLLQKNSFQATFRN